MSSSAFFLCVCVFSFLFHLSRDGWVALMSFILKTDCLLALLHLDLFCFVWSVRDSLMSCPFLFSLFRSLEYRSLVIYDFLFAFFGHVQLHSVDCQVRCGGRPNVRALGTHNFWAVPSLIVHYFLLFHQWQRVKRPSSSNCEKAATE